MSEEKPVSPRTSAGRALHKAEMFDLGNEEDRRRLALAIEAEAAAATPSLDALRALSGWADRMPDAGLSWEDPRYDWWNEGAPMRHQARRVLARLDEGSATSPITEQCQCGHTRAEHESRYDAPNHCTHRCAPPWIDSATPDQGKGEPR